ncbi:MAG: cupredoxin domain-containing protein [Halobacteriales archaeon]|nr:cupredoxin domain-containing protein [Halobacteriales archaeon]
MPRALLLLLPLLATAGCTGAPPSPAAEVRIVDFAFEPQNVTVHVGESVLWTNAGQSGHTVTETRDPTQTSSALGPGATFRFVARAVGTQEYFCQPHPWMRGNVTVQA